MKDIERLKKIQDELDLLEEKIDRKISAARIAIWLQGILSSLVDYLIEKEEEEEEEKDEARKS